MENLDFLVLILYFIIILSVGYINGRNQASTSEYFLGEKKLPWYLIMFSVVATETSVLTFLSIPGLSYLGNIGFLQLSLGYIVGRILISIYLLPHYFNNSIESTWMLSSPLLVFIIMPVAPIMSPISHFLNPSL